MKTRNRSRSGKRKDKLRTKNIINNLSLRSHVKPV